jgi:hypothetical protein
MASLALPIWLSRSVLTTSRSGNGEARAHQRRRRAKVRALPSFILCCAPVGDGGFRADGALQRTADGRRRKDDRRHLSLAFGPCLDLLWPHIQLLPLRVCIPAQESYWSRSDMHSLFFCSTTYQFVNVTYSPSLLILSSYYQSSRKDFPSSQALFRSDSAADVLRASSTPTSHSTSPLIPISASYIKVRAASSRPLSISAPEATSNPHNRLLQNASFDTSLETMDG